MTTEPRGWIDLSGGVRLKVSGTDSLRYLNGQVSNDVRKITPGTAFWACITSHKGKLEALVTIAKQDDGVFYVAASPALRDFLPLRLEKYAIADDVLITDVSDATSQLHFLGAPPPVTPRWQIQAVQRLGAPGCDVWTAPEHLAELKALAPEIPAETAEWLRIDRGIPAWGTELSGDILPPEAGLDQFAVDYHKGCYIGQEVISRLKSVGRVNRLLQRLELLSGAPAQPGWKLFTATGECREAGVLTSVAAGSHASAQKTVALGYLRRDCIAPSARFFAAPAPGHFLATFTLRNT
ncbi:MAG: hypothetical protein KA004_08225 [Verrucomicrobiales bacterium]|nr:hypothetical protein [Verrucomicrobiales bacterium]